MSQRTQHLVERVRSFSNEVIAFVENLSEADWNKVCEWEQWTAGVTAHHIGAGHFAIFNLAAMIVNGEELPQLDMDQINTMSKEQAKENAHCTQAEALHQLHKNRDQMAAFITGLSDDDLDRKGSMPAFQGEVTTEQLIEYVIFQSAAEHFDSMKSAVESA